MHDYLACLYNQEFWVCMDDMRLVMCIQVGGMVKVTVQASCGIEDQGCVCQILKALSALMFLERPHHNLLAIKAASFHMPETNAAQKVHEELNICHVSPRSISWLLK